MSKVLLTLTLLLSACSTITVGHYAADDENKLTLQRAPGSYSAGTVSGNTATESDALLKSTLPCRLRSFSVPDREPVSYYIQQALNSELRAGEKLAAPEGRQIDIVVNRLESDTSKVHDGKWTLDFSYKIGKISRSIQTVTPYAFSGDSATACRNGAEAFDQALRANFGKFFETLR